MASEEDELREKIEKYQRMLPQIGDLFRLSGLQR